MQLNPRTWSSPSRDSSAPVFSVNLQPKSQPSSLDMANTKRPPHMSSPKFAGSKCARSPQKRTPADVLTYRFDSEMVYVQPAKTMEEALDYAQSVFPQLAGVSRSRIAFSVNVRVGTSLRSVRIASMAWKRVMHSLATYEIVDITILPFVVECTSACESDSALVTDSGATSSSEELPPPGYNGDAPPNNHNLSSLGPDLYSSGVFLGCEKSAPFTLGPSPRKTPQALKQRGSVFGWILRRP